MTTKAPTLDSEGKLLRRIAALEQLLVHYRIGSQPKDKLFDELDRTKAWANEITAAREGT